VRYYRAEFLCLKNFPIEQDRKTMILGETEQKPLAKMDKQNLMTLAMATGDVRVSVGLQI
jgi:hypothetical protein